MVSKSKWRNAASAPASTVHTPVVVRPVAVEALLVAVKLLVAVSSLAVAVAVMLAAAVEQPRMLKRNPCLTHRSHNYLRLAQFQ